MDTIRVRLENAERGMVIARDIYNEQNQLIVSEGTILNEKIIQYLASFEIHSILILRGGADYNNNELTISYLDSLKGTEEFKEFNQNYKSGVDMITDNLKAIVAGKKEVDPKEQLYSIDRIISNTGSAIHLLEMLQCIREYDDLTFVHSFNVALICGIFGGWLHYSNENIQTLILSGLLHDLGKLKMPESIILKKGPLTEQEYALVKRHPIEGYLMVKDSNLDARVKSAIMMHHERMDGSGYPYGITGELIQEFAQIVSIADVYDAMTADRIYRKGICPFDVLATLENGGLGKYSPKFLLVFLEHIADSYMNYTVRLNDRRIGDIIMINKLSLSRPVVRVGEEFIDLSRETDLKIVEVI